ncbi:AAA family ATPase [Acinetobacter faecalis]|uniref:McrB family protein n=1 Tax=Acinetobacter faecalis TaxID=2665161 RepID=UPI002A910994|nr:AAA family ATPase [Acinetobacter faecalis]MDY6482886.1 AAA family ATPase [Acinetobacter faecalis]
MSYTVKENGSFYIDKSITVSDRTFKAYINCFNQLAQDHSKISQKEYILTNELVKEAGIKGTNPSNVWSSYYTNAIELGIFYIDESGNYHLGQAAQDFLTGSLSYSEYMYKYACNFELIIENKIIHPLVEIIDNLDSGIFNFESYLKKVNNFKNNDSNKTYIRQFFGRLIQAEIFEKNGNNYKLIKDINDLKKDITHSNLTFEKFREVFIKSSEAQKNIVLEMINRELREQSLMNLNTIFVGPAGTGKTYESINRAVKTIDGHASSIRSNVKARSIQLIGNGQLGLVTFHQSFSYEEFVEGISVTTNRETKQTEYKIKDGIFKIIAKKAQDNPNQNYVLIIDEINRGNVSKIFGELITLLEPSKRLGNAEQLTVRLPYTQEDFGVPNNLYIIGTMNSSDRSLTALDVAMRRRFKFEELLPNPQLFEGIEIDGIEIQLLLEAINERIEYLIGRDYCIGHAYFTSLLDKENQTFQKLADILKNQILPLLQEYFYSDWEKIDLVLGGNSFIQKTELKGKSLYLFQDKSVTPEEVWSIDAEAFDNPHNYVGIYTDIELAESKQ